MIPEVVSFVLLSALFDKGRRFENHLPRFLLRAAVVFFISSFGDGNIFFDFFFYSSVFFLLFDYVLNLMEGRKWCYIGNTAKIDILRNKIFGDFSCWADLMVKLILVSVTLILKTYYS